MTVKAAMNKAREEWILKVASEAEAAMKRGDIHWN